MSSNLNTYSRKQKAKSGTIYCTKGNFDSRGYEKFYSSQGSEYWLCGYCSHTTLQFALNIVEMFNKLRSLHIYFSKEDVLSTNQWLKHISRQIFIVKIHFPEALEALKT